jgi:hypothetical protein
MRATHLVVGLEAKADIEHRLDFLSVEVAQCDEITTLEIPVDHCCSPFECPDSCVEFEPVITRRTSTGRRSRKALQRGQLLPSG